MPAVQRCLAGRGTAASRPKAAAKPLTSPSSPRVAPSVRRRRPGGARPSVGRVVSRGAGRVAIHAGMGVVRVMGSPWVGFVPMRAAAPRTAISGGRALGPDMVRKKCGFGANASGRPKAARCASWNRCGWAFKPRRRLDDGATSGPRTRNGSAFAANRIWNRSGAWRGLWEFSGKCKGRPFRTRKQPARLGLGSGNLARVADAIEGDAAFDGGDVTIAEDVVRFAPVTRGIAPGIVAGGPRFSAEEIRSP